MQAVDLLRRLLFQRETPRPTAAPGARRRAGLKCSSRLKRRSIWAGTVLQGHDTGLGDIRRQG